MTAIDDVIVNIKAFRASADSSPLVLDADLMVAALQQIATGLPTAATQANEEAAISTSVFTNPGVQQFHPSAAKCWANVTVAAGTPTLQSSYNITSITDIATGQLTITINIDFSTANWCSLGWGKNIGANGAVANMRQVFNSPVADAVGTITLHCWDDTAVTHLAVDPAEWFFAGYGDQ